MANTVAGLVVSLGLNATEYYQGLTKAEYQAKKFSQSFSSGMGSLKSVLGGLGIGLVVNEIYDLGKSVISTAANLNDFADQTGSSVENLSKLSNQAEIAGTSFEELQGATLKLAVGMGSAGEKGEKVDRILKTLGVTAKDPAEALQQIAVSFAKYEDGATKAAYAQELFGKSGVKFLATLKDISSLQDVAATTTTKQAQEAEKLEQAYRRISVEATTFKNAILSDVVPALLRVVTEFNAARAAGLGFWESLKLIGTGQISLEDRVKSATKALEEERKAFAAASRFGITGLPGTGSEEKVQDAEKRLRALQALHAETQRGAEDRKFNPFAQQLPSLGGGAAGRAARTQTERISDAQRYLEQLQRQLQVTKELTAVEKLWDDIGEGRLKLQANESVDHLRRLAEQIDAANALKEAEKERLKLAADEARIREQTSNMRQRSLEAAQSETAALAQQNQQMLQEIALIGKDATSIAQMEQARLDDAIAAKQQALAMRINADAYDDEAKAIEDQIRLLQARKGILVQRGVAEQMAADVAKAKEINDLFVNSFAEGASSVIRNAKSIGDAIKGMGRSIADALTNLAAKNIATTLFGAATSSGGGGIFAGIGTLLGGMFGGMAGGGPVAANQPYVVGERGPELFMPKTAGTIIPNSQTGRGNFVFNINVPAGATRSTIEQTQLKFGMALQSVMDRNG